MLVQVSDFMLQLCTMIARRDAESELQDRLMQIYSFVRCFSLITCVSVLFFQADALSWTAFCTKNVSHLSESRRNPVPVLCIFQRYSKVHSDPVSISVIPCTLWNQIRFLLRYFARMCVIGICVQIPFTILCICAHSLKLPAYLVGWPLVSASEKKQSYACFLCLSV